MVKPGLEFFALTFALFKAGAVPVLIDPGMGVKNLGRCLAEAEPEAFIGIPRRRLARRVLGWAKATLRVAVTVGPVRAVAAVDGRRRPGRRARLDARPTVLAGRARRTSRSRSRRRRPTRPPPILFTSGSTGPPKGAVYTHAIFAAQVDMLRDLYGIEPGEVDLCTFPLFALFAPALGMTSVVPEMDATRPARVDPTKIIEADRGFGVTNMFGSPALLRRVGEYGAERGVKLPSLRRVDLGRGAGAGAGAGAVRHDARARRPDLHPLRRDRGAARSPRSAATRSWARPATPTDRGAGVCVGRPVAGMRVEIIRITDEPIAEWSDDLARARRRGRRDRRRGAGRDPVLLPTGPRPTALAKIAGGRAASCAPDGRPRLPRRPGPALVLRAEGAPGRDRRPGRSTRSPARPCSTPTPRSAGRPWSASARPGGSGRCSASSRSAGRCRGPTGRGSSRELMAIGAGFAHTRAIETFLFHPAFPVDIRHNAKIFREKLAVWAAGRVR